MIETHELAHWVCRMTMWVTVESFTVPALAGPIECCAIRRVQPGHARVDGPAGTTGWRGWNRLDNRPPTSPYSTPFHSTPHTLPRVNRGDAR